MVATLTFSPGGEARTARVWMDEQAAALSLARPNLFASVAVYSGGSDEMTLAPSANKFAAMVFYGGPSDNVFGKDFKLSSEAYARALRTAGYFVLLYNHNTGHNLPPGREAAVVPFFLAHPYGEPSPYQLALPASVPSYCQR